NRCPLFYRFRAIDRLPEPKTIAQVKGTLVHAALEKTHELPGAERTYPRAVNFLKLDWEVMGEKDAALEHLVPEDETFGCLVEAGDLVKGYFQMENPQGFDAKAVEMYVDTVLPNNVPVRGFIDRVDEAPSGQVRVVDYKTGKKPKPQYSHDAQFQMRFY